MTNFSIQFLGVGSALAKKNYNTNVIITVGDKKYLMDCGGTAPLAMNQLGITTNDLDGVIISHIHGDHAGGLETIGYEGMFYYQKKPKLFIAKDLVGDIWNKHLAGGMEDLTNKEATLKDYFDVVPLSHSVPFKINGLDIVPFQTRHVPNKFKKKEKVSFSFLIDYRVFWSADMLFDIELLESFEQAHKMEKYFHDCQLFYVPDGVHASLQELETLPQVIRNKMTVMHYGDNIDEFRERIHSNGFSIANQFQTIKF